MVGLRLSDVHKSFGAIDVLKGVNLEVSKGQFLILVGGSGCGKSTLLNMIAGLESITKGEIWIGNRLVNALPPKDRDIAMVFQSYALYPSMTVRDNISFGLQIRKVRLDEQKKIVDHVAQLLQISHLLDRKPRELSGGQRQRVAMGRALARDPELFLFDEPLSNLDAQLRLEMRAEIKMMHKRLGKTVCYVTHDQIEAMTLGDRIAVIKDGTIQQFGPPQEIYDSPSTMYVAGFIGAPPMNFIPGTLLAAGARTALSIDTGVEQSQLLLPFALNKLGPYIGRKVVLGIRPERITNERGGYSNDDVQRVKICIDLLEPTGADTLAGGLVNGKRVVGRLHPAAAPHLAEATNLLFDLSKSVLFDETTGRRIDQFHEN